MKGGKGRVGMERDKHLEKGWWGGGSEVEVGKHCISLQVSWGEGKEKEKAEGEKRRGCCIQSEALGGSRGTPRRFLSLP